MHTNSLYEAALEGTAEDMPEGNAEDIAGAGQDIAVDVIHSTAEE